MLNREGVSREEEWKQREEGGALGGSRTEAGGLCMVGRVWWAVRGGPCVVGCAWQQWAVEAAVGE